MGRLRAAVKRLVFWPPVFRGLRALARALDALIHLDTEEFRALRGRIDRSLEHSSATEKRLFFEWAVDRAAEDVHTLDYAVSVFDSQRREIEAARGSLAGLRVLELGPGHTLASGILLHVHGVERYVGADLFPIACRDVAFYKRLRARLAAEPRLLPGPDALERRRAALARFDAAVDLAGAEARFAEGKVECRFPVDAAKLPFPDGSFDVVLSLAAFEHFEDPLAAIREGKRVLAPGGVGLHQIDLRDHRNFDAPLEFLQDSPEEWRARNPDMFRYTNRFRKSDFERAFTAEGFTIEGVRVSQRAPVPAALRARLHPSFRDRPDEDLEALGVFFTVKKPL